MLAIFAGENKVLAKLAVDSDRALQPFAAVRNRVADFIVQSNTVARATAKQRGALARNFADFPAFLRELGPAMERIAQFADQTTPTFANLEVAAPGINERIHSPEGVLEAAPARSSRVSAAPQRPPGPRSPPPSRCSHD